MCKDLIDLGDLEGVKEWVQKNPDLVSTNCIEYSSEETKGFEGKCSPLLYALMAGERDIALYFIKMGVDVTLQEEVSFLKGDEASECMISAEVLGELEPKDRVRIANSKDPRSDDHFQKAAMERWLLNKQSSPLTNAPLTVVAARQQPREYSPIALLVRLGDLELIKEVEADRALLAQILYLAGLFNHLDIALWVRDKVVALKEKFEDFISEIEFNGYSLYATTYHTGDERMRLLTYPRDKDKKREMEKKEKELLAAARVGDDGIVKYWLNGRVTLTDEFAKEVYHAAIKSKAYYILEFLLAQGVPVDEEITEGIVGIVRVKEGTKPDEVDLSKAYELTKTDFVHIFELVIKNRKLNFEHPSYPFVRKMCEKSNARYLELLFQNGANPNQTFKESEVVSLEPDQDDRDVAVFWTAITHSDLNIVKLFVQYGVDLSYKSPIGESWQSMAARHSRIDVLEHLLPMEGVDPRMGKGTNFDPIHHAFATKKLGVLKVYLETLGSWDEEIEIVYYPGTKKERVRREKPIVFAIESDFVDAVDWLVKEKGVDVNTKPTGKLMSALEYCIDGEYYEGLAPMFLKFIELGAKVAKGSKMAACPSSLETYIDKIKGMFKGARFSRKKVSVIKRASHMDVLVTGVNFQKSKVRELASQGIYCQEVKGGVRILNVDFDCVQKSIDGLTDKGSTKQ